MGSNVTVTSGDVTARFGNVDVAGVTTCTSQEGNPVGGTPSGFKVRGNFVDIVTTAVYNGPITVGIDYDPGTPNPQNLKMFHWVGHWEDVTTSVDTVNHIVYGQVDSLSWFFVGGEWVWVDNAHSAPAFPSVSVGIAGALATGLLAYWLHRRLAAR